MHKTTHYIIVVIVIHIHLRSTFTSALVHSTFSRDFKASAWTPTPWKPPMKFQLDQNEIQLNKWPKKSKQETEKAMVCVWQRKSKTGWAWALDKNRCDSVKGRVIEGQTTDREQTTFVMIIPLNFYYAEFYCCIQIRHFFFKYERESETETHTQREKLRRNMNNIKWVQCTSIEMYLRQTFLSFDECALQPYKPYTACTRTHWVCVYCVSEWLSQ